MNVEIDAPAVKPVAKALVDEETLDDEIEAGVALPESTTEPNLIDEKVIASTKVAYSPIIARRASTISLNLVMTTATSAAFSLMLKAVFISLSHFHPFLVNPVMHDVQSVWEPEQVKQGEVQAKHCPWLNPVEKV